MPKERQRERETGTWRVALQCCVFIYVSYCIPTKPALNNQGWSWWVKPDFLGCLRVVLSKSAFLCPTAGFAVSPTQTVIWAFCFRMSVCAAYCASKSSMGICCQRAAMLTILAIFESIYRQTNRTGGQYFKKNMQMCFARATRVWWQQRKKKWGNKWGKNWGNKWDELPHFCLYRE